MNQYKVQGLFYVSIFNRFIVLEVFDFHPWNLWHV